MTFRISKRSIPYIISIFIIFSASFLTSLWSAVIISSMRNRIILMLLATVIFVILSLEGHGRTLPILPAFLLVLMSFIVVLGYIKVKDNATEEYISTVIIYLIMIIVMKNTQWIRYFWKCAFAFSILYIFTTIWLAIDTNHALSFFSANIYPYENRFSYWVSQGFSFGITDHYSTNGMALANASIIMGALVISKYKGKKSKKYIMVLILTYIALFLTGKRAHLLFTAVALLGALFIYTKNEKHHLLKYISLLIVLLLVLVLAYSFIPQVTYVLNRFTETSSDNNIILRYSYWRAAMNAFNNNKLFGIGWFGFRNNIAPSVGYTGHCHNIYIQLICETGIIGTFVFVFWFAYAFAKAIRFTLYISNNKFAIPGYYHILAIFCMAYQIYFLLYGLTGNPLYDAYVYPMYLVSCVIPIYFTYYKNEIQLSN